DAQPMGVVGVMGQHGSNLSRCPSLTALLALPNLGQAPVGAVAEQALCALGQAREALWQACHITLRAQSSPVMVFAQPARHLQASSRVVGVVLGLGGASSGGLC